MATPAKTAKTAAKKPATTRKPAAKRGPTKAAALKALGLTQEDLDTLKAVASARQIAEMPEPREDASTPRIAPPAPVAPEPVAEAEQTFYVRNLRNADVSIRLSRQEKQKKRLELKPRGQRGDLAKLMKEDLEDEQLLVNVGLLVEIITGAEARTVIEKQVTNIQTAVHPSMALLRNPKGEEYAPGALKTEVPFEEQGVVVARLQPQGGEAGNLPSSGRGVDWAAARNVQASGQVTAPSNGIISDGFAPQNPDVAADAIARRKNLEGPAAGLGEGVQVVLAPTHTVVSK